VSTIRIGFVPYRCSIWGTHYENDPAQMERAWSAVRRTRPEEGPVTAGQMKTAPETGVLIGQLETPRVGHRPIPRPGLCPLPR
jgi:hypothetical protein